MKLENFFIRRFFSIFEAADEKGRKKEFKNRYAASFIVTLEGSIAFVSEKGTVVCDRDHPVFLPQGIDYVNECLEDAVSLVFSFFTLEQYESPTVLSKIPKSFAKERYSAIKKAQTEQSEERELLIMSELYALAYRLLSSHEKKDSAERIVDRACEYMASHFQEQGLAVRTVANHCFVSEIYLRKLFEKEKGITPFRALTEIRMSRAKELVLEKRPIKEIASMVGYSDLYQFSRAYKKHFGYPPSQTKQ